MAVGAGGAVDAIAPRGTSPIGVSQGSSTAGVAGVAGVGVTADCQAWRIVAIRSRLNAIVNVARLM